MSHLQLQASQQRLPPRHATAEASRPKLSLLGDDGVAVPRVTEQKPAELLDAVRSRVASAKFTGKGDAPVVCRLVDEFAWSIGRGIEQSVEEHKASRVLQRLGQSRPRPSSTSSREPSSTGGVDEVRMV